MPRVWSVLPIGAWGLRRKITVRSGALAPIRRTRAQRALLIVIFARRQDGWREEDGRQLWAGRARRRRGASTAARRVRGRPGLAAAATEGCHPQEAASRPTARRKPPCLPYTLRLNSASVRSHRCSAARSQLRGWPSGLGEGLARRRRALEAVEKVLTSSLCSPWAVTLGGSAVRCDTGP